MCNSLICWFRRLKKVFLSSQTSGRGFGPPLTCFSAAPWLAPIYRFCNIKGWQSVYGTSEVNVDSSPGCRGCYVEKNISFSLVRRVLGLSPNPSFCLWHFKSSRSSFIRLPSWFLLLQPRCYKELQEARACWEQCRLIDWSWSSGSPGHCPGSRAAWLTGSAAGGRFL